MMPRFGILAVISLAAGCAPAPSPSSAGTAEQAMDPAAQLVDWGIPPLDELTERGTALLDLGLAEGKAWDYLVELCTVAPQRLAGSRGFERAVDWGFDAMMEAGLQNVRREAVMVPRWVRGDIETCVATLADGSEIPLAVTALGGSIATGPGGISSEVIDVDGLEALDEMGDQLRGKIVFLSRPMRATARTTGQAYGEAVGQRVHGARLAVQHGAVAVIVRSMSTKRDDNPHTGAMHYDEGGDRIPAAALGILSSERLSAALAEGSVRVRLELECEILSDVEQWNVVGEIPGSDLADEIVLVGGHLDAWGTGVGAHDDGAGCAQSIEAARLLIEHDFKPRRTLRVVLFANEENGLAGGRGYAEKHGPGNKHFLAMETDSGAFGPRGIGLSRPADVIARLSGLGAPLSSVGAERLFPSGGGADIGPLREYGCYQSSLKVNDERYFDVHHSAIDTLDQVNPRELQLGAVTMAYWLSIFTNADSAALASTEDDA